MTDVQPVTPTHSEKEQVKMFVAPGCKIKATDTGKPVYCVGVHEYWATADATEPNREALIGLEQPLKPLSVTAGKPLTASLGVVMSIAPDGSVLVVEDDT